MDTSLPTIQNLRQWIKSLKSQRAILDTQISAYESALKAQEITPIGKTKRNRKKGKETLDLESKVTEIYKKHETNKLKLIDVMREAIELYPEDKKITEEEMRGRFNNLKKSGFLVKTEEYGLWRLGQ